MVDNAIPLSTKILVGGCMFALQTIGTDAWPLFFALFGASIGSSFAPSMTRRRAVWHFAAVSILCSLFGVWVGQRYFDGNAVSSSSCAALLAVFFHPLLGLVVERLPRLFDIAEEALRRRVGLPPKGGAS